jgi:hypothetical protein
MSFLKSIYASLMMIPVIIWFIIGLCWWYIVTRKANREETT